ncbi:MAG: PHB depolymerase family esterase [Thermodesulfobacteriota bacterium]|nr:PHB depolymerase family esterase [Thermodesulfobacteriota bacterium]
MKKRRTIFKQIALLLGVFTLLIMSSCSQDNSKSSTRPNTNPLIDQTINATLDYDGMQREYILYVPKSYTGEESVPLVFNFHGYFGTAAEQMEKADFRPIADTEGFIIVHPQGAPDLTGNTQWNSVSTNNSDTTIDDVGFVEALLDTIAYQYNIDLTRVYSAGFSMGGFMSYFLACQLNEKFAAVASVAGSMTLENIFDCNPQYPIPILDIHGQNDVVVPYIGLQWKGDVYLGAEDVIQYWVSQNNCDPRPTATTLPDIDLNDGYISSYSSTVEKIVYAGGDNGITVEHFKIAFGSHSWPGSMQTKPGTNQDIDASIEIWKFFSKYDINGRIE